MRTSDFDFHLPPERIAQHPATRRDASRLMVLDRATGAVEHRAITDLPALVDPGTVVVLNNTRVRKARLFGTAAGSGAPVVFLLLRRLDKTSWSGLVSRAKRQRPGRQYDFPDGIHGTIVHENSEGKVIRFSGVVDDTYLERHGHVPLPPYIRRADEPQDEERYQTVYAGPVGSAAAPTAGLHLTPSILQELRSRGAHTVFVTLHVGLGTFAPIRAENLEEHVMHEEVYTIDREAAQVVTQAHREGRSVMAVGTTAVRTLESAWDPDADSLTPVEAGTSLFIRPGYAFRVVNRLLTNFHTPRSSLLVLVSAFAGRERILDAYAQALEAGYRFFSYGDAMLIR